MARHGNHYVTLGVASHATLAEIKAAYRRLALEHHPDRNPRDPSAHARFVAVAEAYAVLGDTRRRGEYDRAMAQPGGAAYQRSGEEFRRSGGQYERSWSGGAAHGASAGTNASAGTGAGTGTGTSERSADEDIAFLRTRFPQAEEPLLWAMWIYAQATGEPLPGTDSPDVNPWDRALPQHPGRALVAKLASRVARWVRQRGTAPRSE